MALLHLCEYVLCVWIGLAVPCITVPACSATLEQSHAIVPGYQRRNPAMAMALVYTVIVRLVANVVVTRRYL